jgi:hypothetical protein
MMRKLAFAALAAGSLLALSGCAFFFGSHESAPCQPVKNIIFRLSDTPEGVELRLEGDYFPSHNWALVGEVDGRVEPTSGITVKIEGVREPVEPHGSAAPASGLFKLQRDADGKPGAWPLTFKYKLGDSEKVDAYTVEHISKGTWKLSKEAGSFTRFESHGSF